MGGKRRLLHWGSSRREIVKAISRQKAALKIVVKTKDDPTMLRRWVDHHQDIVGLENLVILDNDSSHPDLRSFYADVGRRCVVAQFSGFHNLVHRVNEYGELYAALRSSSSYYAFLDTDEWLVNVDEHGVVIQDQRLTDIVCSSGLNIIPGTWLDNVRGFDSRFWIASDQNHLSVGLRSGKPIISSAVAIDGMINHNWQVDRAFFSNRIRTDFVVLHLRRLSSEQRICANLNKLQAYNAFKGDEVTLERVLRADSTRFPQGNKRSWVVEIQRLAGGEEPRPDHAQPLGEGTVRIREGRLEFSSPQQARYFSHFVQEPQDYFHLVFS